MANAGSGKNAVRHGLSAETVIDIVEDIDDYRAFEEAFIADYDPRTEVELRLASLLWRLGGATMIETELLRIQTEAAIVDQVIRWAGREIRRRQGKRVFRRSKCAGGSDRQRPVAGYSFRFAFCAATIIGARDLAHCFLRLANLDNGVFYRLGRYESAFSRPVSRILFLLKSARVP
jgi:hypothetical protein